MKLADQFIAELEQEALATRRVLDRVPDGRWSWRPHARSFSLGQLALHVATIPGLVGELIAQDTLEIPPFVQAEAASRAELLQSFERSLARAREILSARDDGWMAATWTIVRGGTPVMTVPRAAAIRTIMLNHWYHHRAQLGVYLRLLDVPVPSVYGPSADENPFAEPAPAASA